jgi:hypothetical protein
MHNSFAPIVLFVYNRPNHTENILNSLAQNEEAKHCNLYIFCDGVKPNSTVDNLEKINKVRQIVNAETRFKEIKVTIQTHNIGLSNSIIDGVTKVINIHGTVIVLEDDLIVSPYFLSYMNDSLERYGNIKNVAEIGGCNFFANGKKFPDFFFANMPDTWGWATWQDRWSQFNSDSVFLYNELVKNNLTYKFNTYGSYDMMGMLKDQIFGKVNSWAIRWQAIMVLNDWLCLYSNPAFSNHIESIDATHANKNIVPPLQINKPKFKTVPAIELPIIINAIKKGYANNSDYYGKLNKNFYLKVINKIIKKILLFPVPHGLVMLFKKNKNN